MNRASYSDEITKFATVPQAMERYKIGRTRLMEIAEKAGALRRIGRMVRFDIEVLDKTFENFCE